MTKSPDLEALARRYMDLWQDQLKGLANDRETAEVMARTLELMNAGAQAMAGMAMKATALDGGPENENAARTDKPAARPAAGTAPAGAASGAADDGVAELARRLARLERRVAALEAGPGKSGRKPKPRAGKRKA